MIKVKDEARMTKVIEEEDIDAFSKVSGDRNPIHLDEEYAKKSIFGKRIAHGMLSASFISNVIGNQLPGEGTIYMKQSLKFCRPVFIGDVITAIIEVKEVNYEKGNILLNTICINQNGENIVEGEAYVRNKSVTMK